MNMAVSGKALPSQTSNKEPTKVAKEVFLLGVNKLKHPLKFINIIFRQNVHDSRNHLH